MLTVDSVNRHIHHWIQATLSSDNSDLGGWSPCPYAHMARWRTVIGSEDPRADLLAVADTWSDQWDVVVVAYDPRSVSSSDLSQVVADANYDFLVPVDLLALEDHPDSPEIVNGVQFNNGLFALIMIQEYGKLERVTKMLKRTDYYDRWPNDYYDQVVRSREQLRSRVTNQARQKKDLDHLDD